MESYQEHSLSGRVFHKLRDDILDGKYQKNDELRETAIGQELGVSRTPVREALRQLELEGLVRIVPNKGAYVTGISIKDVRDIYIIRSKLEGLCARWATEYISPEQIDQMEEIILLSEYHSHKAQEESKQVTVLDGKFHDILYEASNSRILEHVLSDFHRYVMMARKTSVGSKLRAQQSVKEHREILEAIKQKDADKAEQLANQHMLRVMEHLHNQEGYEEV